MTVNLLDSMYRAHCAKEYNGQHGHKEVNTIRHAFAPLVLLYGDLMPEEVTPLRLRACRQYWVDQSIARTTIQARMQRLRKAWRWGRSVGLLNCELPDIGHLRYGHAPEAEPVKPVDIALVEATLAHVSPSARIMLKLLMLTGMRVGEVCAMRADEIDTTTQPWVYRPKHHKQSWRGKKREVFIGPRAQMLMSQSLANAVKQKMTAIADAALISAASVGDVNSAASALFTTARGLPWKPTSLYMAVWKACRKHDIPPWHPSQLRHSFATELRQRFGVDAAQVALGHSRIQVTQVYAEPHRQAAIDAVKMVG